MPETDLTALDVIRSVGWLDGFGSTSIDFDECDWSGGDFVVLRGRRDADGAQVEATFHLTEFTAFEDFDDMAMDDDVETFS